MAGCGVPPSWGVIVTAQVSAAVGAPLSVCAASGLNTQSAMLCSMPASAAGRALARYCSLPAMMNSRLAEFMPDTASSVSISSRISPMTSAAPRSCDRRARAELGWRPVMSSPQRITHLDRARDQEPAHMLRARQGCIGAQRRPIGQPRAGRRIQVTGDAAVGLQAIAVLVDAVVGEAIPAVVRAHQQPDADRDDLRTRGPAVWVDVAGRNAGVAGRIDPELHLQLFHARNDFLIAKLHHATRGSQRLAAE